MQLTKHIHIVASGDSGFSMTNPFDCTVFLVDGVTECALIDAGVGVDTQRIVDNIKKAGIPLEKIKKILLTHGHGDHAGGAFEMSKICGAKVYAIQPAARFVSEGDIKALSLQSAIDAGVYAQNYEFAACPVQEISDGKKIKVGELTLTAVEAEGHSAGHCCYTMLEDEQKVLFAGDAVQAGGKIALQAIWDCDLQKYIKTISRLAALKPDIFLPSHGCVSLSRGWLHTDKAAAVLKTLALPKNSIGE